MFDEELLDGSGTELVHLAQSLEHRKRTPIILLVQKGRVKGAATVGEGVLLRQPEPFRGVVGAVRHLLG